jgi:hypothetical protein
MANTGVAPVNLTSDVGKVRVLIGDTDPTGVSGGSGTYLFFSDAEITAILGMYDNNPKLAAARALETIAGSQALLLKSWSSDDLTVRGDAIARELREIAKQLRMEATSADSSDFYALIQTVGCEGDGDCANCNCYDFAEHQHRYNWWN